jgi:hypothetical protein
MTGVCDCCEKPSDTLAASLDGEVQVCFECVRVLWLCPRCDRVADWTLEGDSWMCGHDGCGYGT